MLVHVGCVSTATQTGNRDIVHDRFSEAEEEVRAAMRKLRHDVVTGNVEAFQSHHLDSPKFSKFGPRKHERQTVEETNASEKSFWASVTDVTLDTRDMRVDVFGDVAVVTYYPHVTFKKDGKMMTGDGRQTLVFVKTNDGWLIAHEHGTGTKPEN
jgi:ketosteroid isomerase-like protein